MDAAADPLAGLTMSYDGLVEAGRAARERADNYQWEEGDLALQVESLPPTERPRDPTTGDFLATEGHALKRYAEDIDLPYNTLQRYRQVAAAWPTAARRSAPWAVHKALIGQDDRFELIRDDLTTREAEAIVRQRNSASRGKPGWFELLGEVGDTLAKAGKQLAKAEDAIDREPSDELIAKAREYAGWADDIATRLRGIAA